MKDKYDEAIEFLTENPDRIYIAWANPSTAAGGALFLPCTRRGHEGCGCLTQVRAYFTWRTDGPKELEDTIRGDTRIPESPHDITPESLPVFAEWQRRLDRELPKE